MKCSKPSTTRKDAATACRVAIRRSPSSHTAPVASVNAARPVHLANPRHCRGDGWPSARLPRIVQTERKVSLYEYPGRIAPKCRTGTSSLKAALEQLGFAPCYHMLEVTARPEHAQRWLAADRGVLPHKLNLFDIHMKYGDVLPLDSVLDYLRQVAAPQPVGAVGR